MCFEADFYDEVAIKNSMEVETLEKVLTIQNIIVFLESLGVEDIDVHLDKNYLICPTICHNPLDEAESMKLYYYGESKLFHCFTQCSESFNVFELYRRYMSLNHYDISYFEAVEYVRQFATETDLEVEHITKKDLIKNIKTEQVDFINLPVYNSHAIECFIPFYHPLWLQDGIDKKVMNLFNIRFSLGQNKIIIPHYDLNGKLVGIRARAIEAEDIEKGKYKPIYIGDKIYSHQLGFNLYGLHENQKAIRLTKRAIIFEGELSPVSIFPYINGVI